MGKDGGCVDNCTSHLVDAGTWVISIPDAPLLGATEDESHKLKREKKKRKVLKMTTLSLSLLKSPFKNRT